MRVSRNIFSTWHSLSVPTLLFLCLSEVAHADPSYVCLPNSQPPVFVADQAGNAAYCPQIFRPAYAFGKGPKVLFDEGHANWGKISASELVPVVGLYHAFGELLKADGYQVSINTGRLTETSLRDVSVLVVIAPLPGEYVIYDKEQRLPRANPLAFTGIQALTADEVQVLLRWVAAGGSLLLNTEHQPFLDSARNLLQALGLEFQKDIFDISSLKPLVVPDNPHVIFRGRDSLERVSALLVLPAVGGGVDLKGAGIALAHFDVSSLALIFPRESAYYNLEYQEFCRNQAPEISLSLSCQQLLFEASRGVSTFWAGGAQPMKAIKIGQGRVLVFSEFSTLTSLYDRTGSRTVPYGGLTNQSYTQFVLNGMHWLSGLLRED